MSSNDFKQQYGPVALVTGASSGIGESFAKLLAAAGLDLCLVARRADRLQQLADTLQQEHGVSVSLCAVDLSDPGAIDSIKAATATLDIGLLVNNAGFGLKGAHQENDSAEMDAMLQVNCVAPMQLCHHFIPQLLQRGRGGILFTGSVEGLMGFPYSASYAGSKAFIKNFAESLWGELQDKGIQVLDLCPSSTDTEALDKQGVDKSKLTGMMSPDEVAQIGLDNLANGPVVIAGEQNREIFEGMQQMPRRDALVMMAQTMQESFKG